MKVRSLLRSAANRTLRPAGLELVRVRKGAWDEDFQRWIADAKVKGIDPNDLCDAEWGSDLLDHGLDDHYMPFVRPESVIVEIGPGTGRLTRHVVGRCRNLILLDSSQIACDWLRDYVYGRGPHEIHRIDATALPIPSAAVDLIIAHGVLEHWETDQIDAFCRGCERVLRPGGVVAFNFDTLLSDEAVDQMRRCTNADGRSSFKLHHPDAIRRLGELAGLTDVDICETGSRIAFAHLRKRV